MTAPITMTNWIKDEASIATDNMDNSTVNSREWIQYNARKVAFTNALTVSDNVESDGDAYYAAKSYYQDRIREANDKVVDPGSDQEIAWDARLYAFEEIYSSLKYGTTPLNLTDNQWLDLMEGDW